MGDSLTDPGAAVQKVFCNRPERDTREARWLMFFDKSKLSFNDHLRGRFPDPEDYLFRVRVQDIPGFQRKVARKLQEKIRYEDVQLGLTYFPISNKEIEKLQKHEKTNAYVVVLATNTELQCFGNAREPMSFHIEDGIRDNGSGSDGFLLVVQGTTSVKLKTDLLPESVIESFFKVLLYGMPLK